MGAVNYCESEYITLGLNLNHYDLDDSESMEQIDQMREEVEDLLYEYDFNYFNVELKPGYYGGFIINIENNFGCYLDSYEDRRDVSKEITSLKKFLYECVNMGLVQCHPGWCTGYCTPDDSESGIRKAIKFMRREMKELPTWSQYEREC